MTGIECALQGRLGRAAEPRTTKAGKPMAVLNVAVSLTDNDRDAVQWVRVLAFNDHAEACWDLPAGARVYVEGWLKLEQWTAGDGTPRAGLTVLARLVVPLGRIGRQRPRNAPQRREDASGQPAARASGPDRASERPAAASGDADGGFDWNHGDAEVPF